MPRMSLKAVALLSLPLAAVAGLAIALWLRDDGSGAERRRREQAEVEKLLESERAGREGDPSSAVRRLRGIAGPDATSARADVLRHGEKSIPALKAVVLNQAEAPEFRLECLALLWDSKTATGEAAVLEILADRSTEESYRALALGKLAGRPVEGAFPILRRMCAEEPAFAQRALLLKALGGMKNAEATPLLLQAATAEKEPSARIQAIEALTGRSAEPGVLERIRELAARGPDENIRVAALGALGRSAEPTVDEWLRVIAADDASPAGVRKSAASWLERRGRR